MRRALGRRAAEPSKQSRKKLPHTLCPLPTLRPPQFLPEKRPSSPLSSPLPHSNPHPTPAIPHSNTPTPTTATPTPQVMPNLLSRRVFRKPKTVHMVLPGYRDAPELGAPMAVVFCKVCCIVLGWVGLYWVGLRCVALVWFGLVWFGLVWDAIRGHRVQAVALGGFRGSVAPSRPHKRALEVPQNRQHLEPIHHRITHPITIAPSAPSPSAPQPRRHHRPSTPPRPPSPLRWRRRRHPNTKTST